MGVSKSHSVASSRSGPSTASAPLPSRFRTDRSSSNDRSCFICLFFCSTNPTLAIKSNRVDWNLERGRRCSREVEDYPSLNRSIIRQLPVASLPARIKQDQAPWIPNSTCRQRWEISVQPIGESVAWFPSQRPIPNRILPTGKSKWTASDASMIWSRLILTSSKPTSERNLNQPISHFISLLPLEI